MSLVDVAAAARPLDQAELRAWAGEQRVFISSVMGELADERRAVASKVEEIGAEPVWFEEFRGRDDDPSRAYLSEVASSTIYVGILGRTYGRLTMTKRSATHEEYREAERKGLRISVWVREGEDRQGDQQALLEEVQTFHTGRFSGPEDLAAGVGKRLENIAAEEFSPWTKLGDAIFRASIIRNDGKRIDARASIHDPQVLAKLEAMRPGVWFGSPLNRPGFTGGSVS